MVFIHIIFFTIRCLKAGKFLNDFEERSLLAMILWTEGEWGQINFRVKMLLRYYAEAMKTKKGPLMEPYRKLLLALTKVVAAFDDKEDSKKLMLANYFSSQMRDVFDNLSDQKLWTELYLLEPDWLAVEVCQKLAHNTASIFDTRGLRQIATAMKNMTITQPKGDVITYVPDMTTTEKILVPKNNDTTDSTKQSSGDNAAVNQKSASKEMKVKRNQYGETPLHIACKYKFLILCT